MNLDSLFDLADTLATLEATEGHTKHLPASLAATANTFCELVDDLKPGSQNILNIIITRAHPDLKETLRGTKGCELIFTGEAANPPELPEAIAKKLTKVLKPLEAKPLMLKRAVQPLRDAIKILEKVKPGNGKGSPQVKIWRRR